MEATFHELAQSDIFGHVIHFRYEEFDSFSLGQGPDRDAESRSYKVHHRHEAWRDSRKNRRNGKAKECLTWNWLDGSVMNWTNPWPSKLINH